MLPIPDIEQDASAITVVAPTPGRMRRTMLWVLVGVLLVMVWLWPVLVWVVEYQPDRIQAWVEALLKSWQFWSILSVFAGLLAMDARCRRRVVWDGRQVHLSWLYGPVELFPTILVRPDDHQLLLVNLDRPHLPREMEQELKDQGLESLARVSEKWMRLKAPVGRRAGWGGPWVLGWSERRRQGERVFVDFHEMARFADGDEARALLEDLRSFKPDPGTKGRIPPAVGLPLGEAASIGVQTLMRLPLYSVLALCLSVVVLAAETLAELQGRSDASQFWDGQVEAQVVSFHWRLESRQDLNFGAGHLVHDPLATLEMQLKLVDPEGEILRRPLALHTYRLGASPTEVGDPQQWLEDMAAEGLVPERLGFRIDPELLPIALDEYGALRLHEEAAHLPTGQWDPPDGHDRRRLYDALDYPDIYLPLSWTEPSLGRSVAVVYRAGQRPWEPVWLAADIDMLEAMRLEMDFLFFVAGIVGLVLGSWLVTQILSPERPWRGLLVWLVLSLSALWWAPISPEVATWLGAERSLQAEMRWQITNLCCFKSVPRPQERVPEPLAGYWSADQSRSRDVLGLLDLIDPPVPRLPDYDSARAEIAERATERLALMDHARRHEFLSTWDPYRLWGMGGQWLNQDVVAPAVCAWLDGSPEARRLAEQHARVLRRARCEVG